MVNLATYTQCPKCFLRLDYSKKKEKERKKKEKKGNQNRIKSGLSQFLFPQQKM